MSLFRAQYRRHVPGYVIEYGITGGGYNNTATQAALRIRATDKGATPRQRSFYGARANSLHSQLAGMSDSSAAGSICLELGIGAFTK